MPYYFTPFTATDWQATTFALPYPFTYYEENIMPPATVTYNNRSGYRFSRQEYMVNTKAIRNKSAVVIGCGAIGKPLAEGLVAAGIGAITLFDPDTIEEANITTQGYPINSIKKKKVDILGEMLRAMDKSTLIYTNPEKYDAKYGIVSSPSSVVATDNNNFFIAVDNMADRASIWETTEDMQQFWCDARMMGWVFRCLSAYDTKSREHYASTLFADSDAEAGRCTSEGALWTARMAASLMVNAFIHFVTEANPPADVLMNMLTYEMSFPKVTTPSVPSSAPKKATSRRRATAKV